MYYARFARRGISIIHIRIKKGDVMLVKKESRVPAYHCCEVFYACIFPFHSGFLQCRKRRDLAFDSENEKMLIVLG